jgi:predicted ester cyclase
MPAAASADTGAGDIVEKFAAALTARDLKAFGDLFAGDYINNQRSAAAPAPSGKSAKTATVEFFQNRVDAMSDLSVTIEASLASGEMTAASFVYEGTHDAPYYGFQPTGRKLRFTSCDIFRLRGGLIAEHWGMGDIAGLIAQLKR